MPPFEFHPYESSLTGTIAELMMAPARARSVAAREAGAARARAAEVGGHNAAMLGQTLGNIAQGVGGQITQYYQDASRREMEQLQIQNAKDERAAREASASNQARLETLTMRVLKGETSPELLLSVPGGTDMIKGLQAYHELQTGQVKDARDTAARLALALKKAPTLAASVWGDVRAAAITGGLGDEQSIPPEYNPTYVDAVLAWATGEDEQPQQGFTLSPGETRFGPDGKPLASVDPKAPEPKTFPVVVRGPNGRPVRKLFTEAELAQGVEEYREPKAPASSARFWVMRNGQPIRVTEAEYRVGDAPANTREQGRPVTSGDAGRIADLDTSLDDLNVLTRDLGVTGTTSKIGAWIPNWVTDLTGWGEDAKQRQAVIDRVKQVIGKALEGGVLRKEDEYKYEKILPTIGDPSTVAKAKLQGLWEAIQKRRQTTLDALGDAGYDITKFAARPARTQDGAPRVGDRRMINGQLGEWDGKGWKAVN